jgi:pyruvate dehydrogenase kinase 2/3/4
MISFSPCVQVAGFMRRELPIRLAHRIQDLERVPYMSEMPSVIAVKKLYTQSFLELVEFDEKIIHQNEEEEFARLVEAIYSRHSKVLVQMARGAYEFRDAIRRGQFEGLATHTTYDQMESTHEFLDRFYLCRIGIRVLIGQYLALRQPPVENYIGIICSQTSPYEIVKRAIDDASFMCTRKYGDAPEVIISGRLEQTFPYVPTHLRKLFVDRRMICERKLCV